MPSEARTRTTVPRVKYSSGGTTHALEQPAQRLTLTVPSAQHGGRDRRSLPAGPRPPLAHWTVDEHLWLTLHVARDAADKVRPGGTLLVQAVAPMPVWTN